jgi:hypothetical protein
VTDEIYRWHVSTDLKIGLEREARRRKLSLSAVLDLAVRDWLNKVGTEIEGDDEQLRLRKAASECFGVIASGNAHRSEQARQAVRQRLRHHHDC